MRLILKQPVAGLGDPGDVVEVKDGYGRNYLVPRGVAILATKGAEKQVAQIRRAREVRAVRDLGEAKALAQSLSSLSVQLPVKSGQGGRLFGSVNSGHVATAVKAAGGPQLDKRTIELTSPIKTIGSHRVSVRLHGDVVAVVTVEVVPA